MPVAEPTFRYPLVPPGSVAASKHSSASSNAERKSAEPWPNQVNMSGSRSAHLWIPFKALSCVNRSRVASLRLHASSTSHSSPAVVAFMRPIPSLAGSNYFYIENHTLKTVSNSVNHAPECEKADPKPKTAQD